MTIFDGLQGELRWSQIEDELKDFQTHLASDLPTLVIERQSDVLDWANQKGVYLLFDDSERLLYVGYSLNGFGSRISDHAMRFQFRWADFIVFPGRIEFFAAALEALLITRLKPPLNFRGM